VTTLSATNYSPAVAVGAAQRVLGLRDLFSLWFSLGIGLMVLQTGALLAPGLGLAGSRASSLLRVPRCSDQTCL